MRKMICAAVAFAMLATPALADKLSGKYVVSGKNPGGAGSYEGLVMIEQTADVVYKITWTIEGAKFVGTGIGGEEGLAVSYKSGSDTGVAIFQRQADGTVDGVWTYFGGTQIGTETWTKR